MTRDLESLRQMRADTGHTRSVRVRTEVRVINELLDALPLALVVLAALAPAMWFFRGLPIKGVDSFFSLHPAGRLTSSLSAWDFRNSPGVPASDLIAANLNFVQGGLARLGLTLVLGEALIIISLSGAAAIGMYQLGIVIMNGAVDTKHAKWISALMSILWLANPFSLSFVWAHQLLIEFTWAALPWLLFVMLSGLARRLETVTMVSANLVVIIAGSAGFPHAYLPGVSLLLICFGLGGLWWAGVSWAAIARLSLLTLTFIAGVAWWFVPSLPVLSIFVSAATIGPDSPRAQLEFASHFSTVLNVLTLTAVPILHQSVDNIPYLSWSSLVLNRPGATLVFVLPTVAAIGLLHGLRQRRVRPLVVSALACTSVGVFLSKGLNPPLAEVNRALTELPMGDALRHPLDKFSFVLVLPICLLFGLGLAWLFRGQITRPIGVFAAVVVCGYLAAPWWYAGVIPVGGGRLPSAYVQVPPSYDAVGTILSSSPPLGKTMVLPYSRDGGAAFAWKSGIQPNLDCLLQDWAPNRSVMCHDSGQVLADLVPDNLSQAVTAQDTRVFDLAYLWGVDSWLVHTDWESSYFAPSVPPDRAIAFMTQDKRAVNPPPSQLMHHNQVVRVSPGVHSLQFFVRANEVPSEAIEFARIGPITVQINRASSADSVYLGLRNKSDRLWYPADGAVFRVGTWHAVTLRFESLRLYFSVDGVEQEALAVCGPAGCHPSSEHGMPLAAFPATVQMTANQGPIGPDMTLPNELHGMAERRFVSSKTQLVEATPELDLFKQRSLPAVYAAKSVARRDGLDAREPLLQAALDTATLLDPVLLPSSSNAYAVDPNSNTSWSSESATHLHGLLQTSGPAILVLLQTYDTHWILTVNGRRVPDSSHFVANGFANAWSVDGLGSLGWTLDYTLQGAATLGAEVGGGLLVVAVLLPLSRVGFRIVHRRVRLKQDKASA